MLTGSPDTVGEVQLASTGRRRVKVAVATDTATHVADPDELAERLPSRRGPLLVLMTWSNPGPRGKTSRSTGELGCRSGAVADVAEHPARTRTTTVTPTKSTRRTGAASRPARRHDGRMRDPVSGGGSFHNIHPWRTGPRAMW